MDGSFNRERRDFGKVILGASGELLSLLKNLQQTMLHFYFLVKTLEICKLEYRDFFGQHLYYLINRRYLASINRGHKRLIIELVVLRPVKASDSMGVRERMKK